jgi:hypothetical protein
MFLVSQRNLIVKKRVVPILKKSAITLVCIAGVVHTQNIIE